MPLGSVLSVHLPAVPQNFNVYCSWNLCHVSLLSVYPSFPVVFNQDVLNQHLEIFSVEVDQVRLIEESTQF